MRLVSPLLKRIVYPGLSQVGYLKRHARNGQLCVVTYHGVRPEGYESIDPMLDGSLVTRSALRTQIRLLKSHYNIVAPEDVRQWIEHGVPLRPQAVLLTCDDGLKNSLTEMLPVLQDEGVSCLFFVTGASTGDERSLLWYEALYLMVLEAQAGPLEVEGLGIRESLSSKRERRNIWWKLVMHLSQFESEARTVGLERIRTACGLRDHWCDQFLCKVGRADRFQLLVRDELQQLVANGMSIGAHTLSHPVLPQATERLALCEIAKSKDALQESMSIAVWAIAYPFGDPSSVTARELTLAKEAGYSAGFVNYGGGFGAKIARFSIPRVHVTSDMRLGEFEALVSGFYGSLKSRYSRGELGCGIPA